MLGEVCSYIILIINFGIKIYIFRTCPTNDLPQGFGEKLLLRTLAYKLGLKSACVYKKRALQFGSRIANKKENANEISERLL